MASQPDVPAPPETNEHAPRSVRVLLRRLCDEVIPYIMAGHELHHRAVLEERYL